MAIEFLKGLSQAAYVEYGYAQVEPNHLSAQRTGQIYAQLPAASDIDVLENGQFVKYDYEKGLVNFEGKGEWMLVFNEIKLYRDEQDDCEFAMKKGNYFARVYSPSTGDLAELKDEEGNYIYARDYRDIVAPADPYSLDAVADPFRIYTQNEVKLMPEDTTMVPRVLKTNVGDIFTTNCIAVANPTVGMTLAPAAKGILAEASEGDMLWQVVKVYTMPDYQKGVKVMRIK
jgi:hypothetical protein